jgi:NAD(P)H-dependent flavin oxidoreductase YrpB (nitropropane dioxygenase family)
MSDSLKELLKLELPIIQAPMAGVQGSALAIAVSNAGGLGSVHTALTNRFSGRPARAIVNRIMRELGPIGEVSPFPLAATAIGPLRSAAEAAGLGDFSALWSGQNASGCREIPAAQMTRELAQSL